MGALSIADGLHHWSYLALPADCELEDEGEDGSDLESSAAVDDPCCRA